tara:strand:+ start:13731 stop:13859 length:129 start_codon:yes stop_codon:yes gene_type:complete
MAKKVYTFEKKKRVKRGIHAKSKTSKNKGSENYKKQYNGQGK